MTINPNMKEQLLKISNGPKFINPASPVAKYLAENKFIAIDQNTRDPANPAKFAFEITATGAAELPAVAAPAPLSAPAGVSAGGVAIHDAFNDATATAATTAPAPASRVAPVILTTGGRIKMPAIERKGRKAGTVRPETYPFSTLEAPVWDDAAEEYDYDSFFVASTESNPNPTKTLAGTISGANKRWKEEGRKFSAVHVSVDVKHGVDGARVLRVDDTLSAAKTPATVA